VIEIDPKPLNPDEKPREVFISYAWGNDTPEGKIHAQAVDSLASALEGDGFVPVRDRDQVRPGDRISDFIRRLTRADLIVAVISDRYLRSPYCMYEIYRVWQRSQADADLLSRVLVPVVLPEVRVSSLQERLPYMEHWAEQAETLEALVRNTKLRPSSESWEEVRLVREFSHHVDDILVFLKDVLMPRNLEAHLDDGFQAVREALRRRM
jgi:internalin A